MKRFTIIFIALCLGATTQAQTDVYLKINHLLGTNTFDYSTAATNNLSNAYEFTRLEYYISEIKLTYDGGQDTVLEDTYLLVRGDESVNELIGTFNFTTLESITFGVGVDPSKNNADPATYPSGHPLGFHLPSMHWGWAAGYRFAALEGNSGAAMNQRWEVHALGNKNYGYATVATAGTKDGTTLTIALNADYQSIFKDVTVNSTLNYHGEDQQTPLVLSNFQNEVFSEGPANIGLEDEELITLSLAPNPTNGAFFITAAGEGLSNSTVIVRDAIGRTILTEALKANNREELHLNKSGIYFVSLLHRGEILFTRRLVVKQ